ncbi:hypothetical protein BH18VER1_BH18VER1_01970 [soil metagenome]
MPSHLRACSVLLSVCCFFSTTPLRAATLVVTTTHDSHVDGQLTLREAIEVSSPGDVISVDLPAKIELTGSEIVIGHDLIIKGPLRRTQVVQGIYGERILRVAAGVVQISNLTFTGAAAFGTNASDTTPGGDGEGGAIYNGGTLTLRDCQLVNNFVNGGSGSGIGGGAAFPPGRGFGAGIYNAGQFMAVRCLFESNTAAGGHDPSTDGADAAGGAIYNAGSSSLVNCTFCLNSAGGTGSNFSEGRGGSGRGGAVFNASSLAIKSSTFARNGATGAAFTPGDAFGGAIFASDGGTGQTSIQNTIAVDNHVGVNRSADGNPTAQGPNVFGAVVSQGHNLIGSRGGSTGWIATDQVSVVDAGLQQFPFDNGGPTRTFALRPGSPAIDGGFSANLPHDQRRLARTYDDPAVPNAAGSDGTDIGAFELQPAPPSRLRNVSARVHANTGDGAAIVGLIISGQGSRPILFRGIGPQLFGAGLPDAMSDPTLEIYSSSGESIAHNDNWTDTQRAAIEALDLYPLVDTEPAILITLDPGQYTAVLHGKNNEPGIALVECYDLSGSEASRVANLSVRGRVGTNDDVIIDGFLVAGDGGGLTRVVLRALGPSLAPFQLDTLEDPLLTLHDEYGNVMAANDNWRDTQESEIAASGLAPDNDQESAILADVPPGSYTAVARGKGETTGVGLVEIYGLQ